MKEIFISIFVLACLVSCGQTPSTEQLWNSYNAGDYNTVIEKGKALLSIYPSDAELNLLIGRAYTELRNYQEAIPYLHLAKSDSLVIWRKAWALNYLGICYFMLQQYNESQRSFDECIHLNATKNVTMQANGYSILFGSSNFYKGWKIVETEHFRFHFQDMTDDEIQKFTSVREKAYTTINSFFNSTLPKKIDMHVWQSTDEAKQLLGRELGFSKPQFCVIHTYHYQTVGHELTHVISYNIFDKITPTLFISEGTAVCFDLSTQDRLTRVQEWLKANNKKVALKDLWTKGDSSFDQILYPLAGIFVKELIEHFGKDKFLEFFKNQTYDSAKVIFGDKLDSMIQELENKVNG